MNFSQWLMDLGLRKRTRRKSAKRVHATALINEALEPRVLLTITDLGAIRGVVYNDLTDNGQTVDDTLLNGVTVQLFRDGGDTSFNNGGADDTLVGTAVTAAGEYSFTGLTAGRYFVRQLPAGGFMMKTGTDVVTIDISAGAAAGTQGVLIDDFSEPVGGQLVTVTFPGTPTASSSVAAPAALGGERDVFLEATAGSITLNVNTGAFPGDVNYDANFGATGNYRVVWDGVDGSSVVNPTGLGSIDLTASDEAGFLLSVGTTDAVSATLIVHSSGTDSSIATVPIPAGPADSILVPFSAFAINTGAGADFSSVGAIELEVDAPIASTETISSLVQSQAPTFFDASFANFIPMSLGNLVFRDVNNNGVFDAGPESGIDGVALTLFADTDSNGLFDSSIDTIVATTVTAGGGLYQFTNLFPDDYFVQVDASNFTGAGVLTGLLSSTGNGTAPDPDDDVDNDDNGDLLGAVVVSAAITLSNNGEPITDGDADINTNLSLDFGFFEHLDVSVTKTANVASVIAGSGAGNVVFTVTVTNQGPLDATGVLVTDTAVLATNLPAGVTFVSAVGSGSTSFDSISGNWTVGNLNVGASETLTITLTVGASAADGLILTNTATLSDLNEIDSDQTNNSQSAAVTVNRSVDLAVLKTDNVDPVVPGSGVGNLVYTVSVTNNGPSDASGVTISDTDILAANLPAGVTFVSAAGSNSSTFDSSSGVWTIGAIPAGESRSLTITLTVGAGVASGVVMTNTASVATVTEVDADPSNNSESETTSALRQVDIAVTKLSSAVTVIAGSGTGNLVYTITATNNGPSDATGLVVTDNVVATASLPPGVTLVSAVGTGGSSFNSGTGQWTIGNLPSGESRTLTVTLTVGASAADTLVLNNTASVLLVNETDIVPANNSASTTTNVDRNVDIEVTKDSSANTVIAGSGNGNLVYTVTAQNTGPSNASGLVISDAPVSAANLPAGVTLVSAVGSNGSTFNPTTGLWTIGNLAVGETRTLTITLTVGASAADSLVINNTATVSVVNETDTEPDNDSDSVTTEVDRSVDIAVTKAANVATVVAGSGIGNLAYTVTSTNTGPSNASGVVVTDTAILPANLPAGVSLVSVVGSGTSTFNTTTGLWTIGDLAVGESRSLTVTLTVSPSAVAGLQLQNTATLNDVNEPDSNITNNSQTVTTLVNRQVDLVVNKTAFPNPVIAGSGTGNLVYTITTLNAGSSDASGVTVTDNLIQPGNLPAGVTFVSASSSNGSTFNAGTGVWTIGTLPSGSIRTLTITLTVGAGVQSGVIINNSAAVSSVNEPDTTPGNNTSSISTRVDRNVDIAIQKTQSPSVVIAGSGVGNLVYTVMATNNGPSNASGVQVSDLDVIAANLPTGVSLVSAAGSNGTTFNSSTGIWTIGNLDSGASQTLTLTLTVSANAAHASLLDNTASLSAVNEPDVVPINNNQTVVTQITRRTDIAVTKTQNVATVIAGSGAGNLTYTVTAQNNGPSVASGVILRDLAVSAPHLPAGITVVSATGSGGTSFNTSTGLWTIGDLGVGESRTLTIVLTVGSSTAESVVLSNTASLYAINEPDTNRANNSQTVRTEVDRQVDVAITKSQSTTLVTAGSGSGNLVYTLIATNNGPSDASGLTILDDDVIAGSLPAGVTFHSASGTNGSSFNAATGVWTIGNLAAGASQSLIIRLTVGSTTADVQIVNNTASLNTLNEPDTNAANNSQTVSANVQRRVDLAITKADSSDPSFSPGTLTYTIVVRNNGPSQATGVLISDTLASGTTFVSGGSTLGTVNHSGGVVTVFVGTLNVGQSATVTINTSLNLNLGGNLLNIANVQSTEIDTALGNNSAAEPTTIEPTRGSISGNVFQDLNRNLLRDSGERAIAGTTILLFGTDIRGNAVVRRTTTNVNGVYSFTSLIPGIYNVYELQPNYFADGAEIPGTGATATIGPDSFLNLTLNGGVNAVNFNFAEGIEDLSKRPFLASSQSVGQQQTIRLPVTGTGVISGTAAVDTNRNGLLDAGDTRIPGIQMTLAGVDNAGNAVILQQTTNANGQYSFGNLPAGQFSVMQTQPFRYSDGAEQPGTLIPDEVLDNLFALIPLPTGGSGSGFNFLEKPDLAANPSATVPTIIGPAAAGNSGRPTIEWTPVSGTASYEVRIDRLTGSAGTVVSQTGITATSWTVNTDLALGQHRVWVRAFSTTGVYSAWSSPVTFSAGVTATPLMPAYETIDSTPVIDWSNIPGATSYDLTVINLTTGQNALSQTGLTSSHFYTSTPLPVGQYRFTVRGRNADVVGNWSPGFEFAVSAAPTIRTTLRLNSSTPTLQWDPVLGAVSYEIWLDDMNGVNPVRINGVTTAPTNALSVQVALDLGNYRYYVRAVDAAGNRTAWSTPSSFTVAAAPTVVTPSGNTIDTTPTFTWTPVPGALRYDVWVSNRQTGLFVRDQNVLGTSHTFAQTFPGGDYRVWVQAIGANGPGAWSVGLDFTVHDITAPTILTPTGVTNVVRPTISWTASPNAVRYELWVDKVGGPTKVIHQTNLTTTSYTPTSNLSTGVYRIWMRAFNSMNIASAWSAASDITIV